MKYFKYYPYIVALLLLVTGSFLDYQIDAFLYDPTNLYGIIYEKIILIPFMIALPLVFSILYRIHNKKIFLLLQIIISFYVYYFTMNYFFDLRRYAFILSPGAIMLSLICSGIVRMFNVVTLKRYEKHCIFYVCVFFISMLITTLLKTFWGRIRFRDLQDISQFTPWYHSQGINSHNSFPSAHTTAFSSILCLLTIKKKNHYQNVSIFLYIIVYGGIASMMLARLIAGAHYLSDTVVGFMIAYTIYLICKGIFYREEHYGS